MSNIKQVTAIVVLSLMVPLLTQAQPNTPPASGPFKSAEANAAVKEADVAEARARAEFEKTMVPIRNKLIESLNAAKDKATKAGDLDEAVKLRDKINELKAANLLSTAMNTLPGDWKVKGTSKFQGTLRLTPDGNAAYIDHADVGAGKWSIQNGKVLISWIKIKTTDTYTLSAANQMNGSSEGGDVLTATRP